ncbi:hypothetical protein [Janthinobacterium fluminis]|uniref:Bacteriocin-type signal sequence-containing protein n=1 Tax=Janthinobacterium fluminis TaxID=2987524 RepID=A0ABT5K1F6_9BURK|nr:hypothetical protein [Janthinobacterium fluminis]MDC8758806.1 hypothetical protein [Janthinobacterium fluminis]
MSNEKLKGALKSEIIKKNESDVVPADSVEITDGDLDGLSGGGCALLNVCFNFSGMNVPPDI